MDSIVTMFHECIVEKKTTLSSKKKLLTRRLEEALVLFVNLNDKTFNLEGGAFDLPGRVRVIIRMHATNFLWITKREMCHDITEGGTRVKSIGKYAFKTDMVQLREEQGMRKSGKESMYYITGWLLRAALKAAKQRDIAVREQLHVLVENASLSKVSALEKRNIPTAKVETVEQFGGLR